MFKLGWEQVQGKLIDERLVERKKMSSKHHKGHYAVMDYMVEVAGPGGPVRLVIRVNDFDIRAPKVGSTVPLLVNKDRTKAEFDLANPDIGADAARKRRDAAKKEREKDRQARGEARFRQKLGE